MSDTYCDLEGWTPESMGNYFESPQRPPLRYFGVSKEINPWEINHIVKCGPDVGRFQSMVSEAGVPYQRPFKEMAVGPDWATSHYMNNRLDMAVTAVAADGKIIKHPAGVIGWSHPDPETIRSVQDLYDRTDRSNPAREEDEPKVRANIHNYAWTDPDTGEERNFVIATGWVLPSVTRAEVVKIENAGISGVTSVVSTINGVGVEMFTADLVRQGRQTSAQIGEPTLQAASIRVYDFPDFKPHMASEDGSGNTDVPLAAEPPNKPNTEEAPVTDTSDNDDLAAMIEGQFAALEDRINARLNDAGIVMPEEPVELTMEERIAALEGFVDTAAGQVELPDFAGIEMAAIGDTALSRVLNSGIRSGEARYDFYRRVAKASGHHFQSVRQISNGQISCPPQAKLEGMARAVGVSVGTLIAAAQRDGCTRYED